LVAVALGGLMVSHASMHAQTTYVGEAAVAKANVIGIINASVNDTGMLPPNGGSLAVSLLDLSAAPALDLHLLTANTVGRNDQTQSQAAVTEVTLNAAGIYVTASVLNSTASATCYGDHAEVSGNSTLVALRVNGLTINVTGKPNQTVPLLIGSLVINEQTSKVTGPPFSISGDMIVNALHLKVDPIADLAISTSHAGVVCTPRVIGIPGD
jgi:hypothetical protein